MVVKGGYGVYYDSLNATAITPNQLGFSTVTTVPSSNDFGQTWVSGNPRRGISPLVDPFPVRADGTRFVTPVGHLARRKFRRRAGAHLRQPRSRARPAAAVACGRAERARPQHGDRGRLCRHVFRQRRRDSFVGQRHPSAGPAEYWNHHRHAKCGARDRATTRNVPNPFFIGNLTALRASNPALYNQLAAQALFTSPTIQKNRLLRPFPHMSVGNGLQAQALPLGKVRTHAVEVSFQRRFSQGLSLNAAYSGIRAEEWLNVINEYDAAPTQWVTSQNARPHRVTLNGVYELPFGRGRRFLTNGGLLGMILGGWQTGQTFEWQPGPLLQFGNVFFYGDVDDIALDDPTLDQWFNVDAGFERSATRIPADFQERLFPLRVDGLRGDSDLAAEQQHLAIVPADGAVDAADSAGRREHAEPSTVRQSAAQPHGDRFRPRDGEREHGAAVPDPDVEGDVLSARSRAAHGTRRRAARASGGLARSEAGAASAPVARRMAARTVVGSCSGA